MNNIKRIENPKLNDVEKVFRSLTYDEKGDPEGNGFKLSASNARYVSDIVAHHVQGIGKYLKDGKDIFILSHNNVNDSFFIVSDNSDRNFDFNGPEGYNHLGGMQIIGDYLVTSAEDGNRSVVNLYDLTNINTSTKNRPELISKFSDNLRFNDQKAGAVGITRYTKDEKDYYVLATCDSDKGTFYFYRSKENQSLEDATFEHITTYTIEELESCQSINLLTDNSNKTYFAAFKSIYNFWGGSYKDFGYLYECNMEPGVGSIKRIGEYHFKTNMISISGINGIHFRWGTGLDILNENTLYLYVTAKNYRYGGNVDCNYI